MQPQSITQRISSCLRSLILDEPFFGALALKLRVEQRKDVPTFATDGTHLFYNTDFARDLTDKEITFVLAHEVLHCALGHLWRRSGRDPEKWNYACDFVINAQLLEHIENGSQVMTMPVMGLHDPQYAGMSAEQIYPLLPDIPEPLPNPCGVFTDPPPDEGDEQEDNGAPASPGEKILVSSIMSEAEWKIAATQAMAIQNAMEQGDTPSEIERLIREHITPTIPWQEHLRQFTNAVSRDDYTWKQLNPRYLHTGFGLPTLRSEAVGDIVIAIDTSGSVNDKLLALFLSETQSLLDSAKPASITLLSCDATVHHALTYHHGDDLTSYTPTGGGGTSFVPVFDHIRDEGIDPVCLIYFTDGRGSFPGSQPHYPTLWLHYGRAVHYPFGHVIEIPPSQLNQAA